ncbi:MAG: hypothetical protein AB8B94_00540 [Hyphomicrobiales bacterium]
MNKRQFLSLAAFGLGTLSDGLPTMASNAMQVEDAGTRFQWYHKDGQLIGKLSAPTDGWIAVGFNDAPTLRNTRFVIAVTAGSSVRAEEHIALVPDHRQVTELGFASALMMVSGSYENGRSHLSFSLLHQIQNQMGTGQPALSLSPGSKVHLMLAWSRAPEFNHHSAWRKHFNITL